MSAELIEPILWAIGMALLAGVLFTGIGLISGTDETAIVAPLALLVILIGVPPSGVIAFFLAAIIAKHISHAYRPLCWAYPATPRRFRCCVKHSC